MLGGIERMSNLDKSIAMIRKCTPFAELLNVQQFKSSQLHESGGISAKVNNLRSLNRLYMFGGIE